MNKKDKLFGLFIFGFIIFIYSFLFGWWLFYLLNINVMLGVVLGIIIGIILNVLFLKRIIKNMYQLSLLFLLSTYTLYSIGIFGFFMGVPVFNIILGLLSGWYIGRRIKINHLHNDLFKKTNLFGLFILFLICIASATIALCDTSTGANIQYMLGLDFEVTHSMIIGIIIIGGISLLIIQYYLTKLGFNLGSKN